MMIIDVVGHGYDDNNDDGNKQNDDDDLKHCDNGEIVMMLIKSDDW